MGIVYLIGGGNLLNKENYHLDKEILKDTKKACPKVLYISAASSDSLKNINDFSEYFKPLNCEVKALRLVKDNLTRDEVIKEFNSSDVIYFGGGHTETLIETILKYDLKPILKDLINDSDKVLAGISAGAIMFMDYGYGDKFAYLNNFITRNYRLTKGLGIYEGIICPHYQNKGMLSFHDCLKDYDLPSFALEDNTALKIEKEEFQILRCKNRNVFFFDNKLDHLMVFLKEDFKYKINERK